MKSLKISILAIVLVILLVAASGFFVGMKYQQTKRPSRGDFQGRMGTRQGFPGTPNQQGSQAVRGEIINKDEGSITVKLTDNSSKIVLISETTEINKATKGSAEDLQTGQQVMVFGQKNEDGSVSALNIQLGEFGEGFIRK
ncbi:MAG TPA: DUF5666 domain-containing protein [Candidatus Bathyarchaeia archaeon]|nr:DUF5666 domain-containing protein [Candidatus Bathyarchaeia archaeon]